MFNSDRWRSRSTSAAYSRRWPDPTRPRPSPPGHPEARATFRRATCVAVLKRRIEHDALGRAGEHRAIRVGRAGEGIDIRGQDRERP
jgi:hypothetical protein